MIIASWGVGEEEGCKIRTQIFFVCSFWQIFFVEGDCGASLCSQQHVRGVQFLQGGQEPGPGPHGRLPPPAGRPGHERCDSLRLPGPDRDQHEGGADVGPEEVPAGVLLPRHHGLGQDPGQAGVLRDEDDPGGGALADLAIQQRSQPWGGGGGEGALVLLPTR